MNRVRRAASLGPVLSLVLTLLACASAPPYALYSLADAAPAPAGTHGPALRIEVLPASVPAQVRHPQFVVTDGDGVLRLVEDSRWSAPLDEEIAAALSLDLSRLLDAVDVARTAQANGEDRYRIGTDVVRFESAPGEHVAIDVVWSVRRTATNRILTCRSAFREAVRPGYAAMVQGHRRALGKVAESIAAGIALLQRDRPGCPGTAGSRHERMGTKDSLP